MENKDQPAFPRKVPDGDEIPKGLTKREYFAGLIMQGLVSGFIPVESRYSVNDGYMALDEMAIDSVKAADTLLKALES